LSDSESADDNLIDQELTASGCLHEIQNILTSPLPKGSYY